MERRDPAAPLPALRLLLLALAVLAVSAASLAADARLNAAGVLAAVALMAALARLDGASPERLLPRAAFRPGTPLGATYAAMALLVAGTTTIVFVPLLLQELHGLPPLAAGYLTVVEALGWTGAALATSAAGPKGARRVIAAGPAVMLAGLLGLAWSMPGGGGGLAPIALWLALVGAGVGMGWAHLASHALAVAPEGERDLAASSISTVQLLATAFGSALAGMVANLAGLSDPGSAGGTPNAARWLFAVFTAAPALAGAAVATTWCARPSSRKGPKDGAMDFERARASSRPPPPPACGGAGRLAVCPPPRPRSDPMPPHALFEAHLDVRDLDRSIAFYRDVVGLEPAYMLKERDV